MSLSSLVLVRVSVLTLLGPTAVTLTGGDGKLRRAELSGGALAVDGAAADRLRVEGAPFVTVAVTRGRGTLSRRFRGAVEVRAAGDALALTDELPDEDYLPGTVALESESDHGEQLRAQAIVARTYLARARSAGGRHASEHADLCDTTHCQTYRGADGETDSARAAVAATAGQVLTFQGRLAEVYFTARCGGATADAADVWPDAGPRPYLRSVPCPACARAPGPWSTEPTLAEVDRALDAGGRMTGLTVVDRGAGGQVKRVRLDGAGRTLTGEQLRLALGRALGWSTFRSARFTVERRGDRLRFSGTGFGHGVGLCEAGASALAHHGADHRAILRRYFPGTEVAPRP